MEINTQEAETESIIENKTEERENALVKHARHELNLILEEAETDGDEEDIRMQNENDTVIDCCMGSGSTGIVALQNNRNFIGIELDEKYFNIAKERIEKTSLGG